MQRRYRVLLIAEAANPEWTSVPLIGWSLSQALAKVTDAHLVTHVRNREAILRAGLIEGRDFTAIDNENVAGPVWKLASFLRGGAGKGWTTISAFSSLAYYSFEREVWKRFGARIAAREFDLVHRITPLSPTHQSPIADQLATHNVPFVIGPLNGGVPWPKNFVARQHAEREWLAHIRGLFKLMPGYRATRRHSAAIIVGSKHTGSEMPHWAQDKCIYIPENAVDLARFSHPRTRRAIPPLKAAFIGRLVPYKGADMLLRATADFLREGRLALQIIGDGPQRQQLEALVDSLGVRGAVTFHGWVAHENVQNTLKECDFMALPSIREFGGGVVVEAMALGVAPIVADYGGPAELVDSETGIRIGFDSEDSLVDGFKRAIADVLRSPETLDRLGAAAREKVRATLTWDSKAGQIIAIYDAVLAARSNLKSLDWN
jgi:glycosyltransferase involved in cell wall biosynthesis